jgi:Uma2 family endonuclease
MTAAELLGFDAPGARVELERGRLVVREPAGWRHGGIGMRLALAIGAHLERERERAGGGASPGWVLGADTGFLLSRGPDTVRAPDVAYLSRARWPAPLPEGFGEGAPDLVVEVRSPQDRPGALVTKVGEWLDAGAELVWVVDPARGAVTVYRADGTVAVRGVADLLDGEAVLPGFTLAVGQLFGPG